MRSTLDRLRHEEGFSLVELLIVISILGVLAGIAVFAFDPFSSAADTAAEESDDRICATATEAADALGLADADAALASGDCTP